MKLVFLSPSELVRLGLLFWLSLAISEAYQKLSQSSRMELFIKIVHSSKPLTTFSGLDLRCFNKLLTHFCIRQLPLFFLYFAICFWYGATGVLMQTSANKSYNRWVLSVKKVFSLSNFVILWRSEFCNIWAFRGEGSLKFVR